VENQVVRAFVICPAHLTFSIINDLLEQQVGFALNFFPEPGAMQRNEHGEEHSL